MNNTGLKCPNCKENISQIEFECKNCGFPLDGTEKEKAIFISWSIFYEDKLIVAGGNTKESEFNDETEKQIRAIAISIYFEDLFK